MFRKIDHIGIAVRSIAVSARFYAERIGMPVGEIETVPTEGVRVVFLGEGETHFELFEPIDETGPVARFLEKRGEGLHHICFQVEDIDASVAQMRAAGVRLSGEAPRPGARGCRVAFVHPKETGGVLVELTERPRARREAARVRPGCSVLVYLRDPKERFWGVLRDISEWGATIEGIDLASFDLWTASAARGEADGGASTVVFPSHRIERILLDRPSGSADSLEDRFRSRVGCSLEEFLARGR